MARADREYLHPVLLEERALVISMATRHLPRQLLAGFNAYDITALADSLYGDIGLPAMVGSDALSWQSITETGGDGEAFTLAQHRCGLNGGRTDIVSMVGTVGPISLSAGCELDDWQDDAMTTANAAHTAVYTPQTLKPWPTRTGETPLGTLQPRKLERELCEPTLRTVHDGPALDVPKWRDAMVTHCLAPADDSEHAFIGHELIVRPEPSTVVIEGKRNRATVQNRQATRLGDIGPTPSTHSEWVKLVKIIAVGTRVTVSDARGNVHVGRSKSGTYSATDHRDGIVLTYRTRNADTMAAHLASR